MPWIRIAFHRLPTREVVAVHRASRKRTIIETHDAHHAMRHEMLGCHVRHQDLTVTTIGGFRYHGELCLEVSLDV